MLLDLEVADVRGVVDGVDVVDWFAMVSPPQNSKNILKASPDVNPLKTNEKETFFIGMAPKYRLSKFASQRLEISSGHTFLLCRLLPDTIAEPRMRCSRPREVLLQKFIKVN